MDTEISFSNFTDTNKLETPFTYKKDQQRHYQNMGGIEMHYKASDNDLKSVVSKYADMDEGMFYRVIEILEKDGFIVINTNYERN